MQKRPEKIAYRRPMPKGFAFQHLMKAILNSTLSRFFSAVEYIFDSEDELSTMQSKRTTLVKAPLRRVIASAECPL